MKPERKRNFGHPLLVGFVTDLAASIRKRGLEPLAVGDLGQVRGGPAPNGHASHQNGLDVDLWFSPPSPDAEQHSMVDLEAKVPSKHWSERAFVQLELSAKDKRVARIFVHAVIKKQLCETAKGDRRWLRKLRPWYGHHEHFHVRLQCPDDSPECKAQPPVPTGDGCEGVDWWLSDEAEKDRNSGGSKYAKRVGAKPELPKTCAKLATQ
jgi:penicillin-insensitive murein endopeptidase